MVITFHPLVAIVLFLSYLRLRTRILPILRSVTGSVSGLSSPFSSWPSSPSFPYKPHSRTASTPCQNLKFQTNQHYHHLQSSKTRNKALQPSTYVLTYPSNLAKLYYFPKRPPLTRLLICTNLFHATLNRTTPLSSHRQCKSHKSQTAPSSLAHFTKCSHMLKSGI